MFTDILRRFPATVELAVAAIVLAVLFGIPVGIVSAVWRKSLIDSLSRVLALTGVSMPIFWLGVMLAWVFAVELHWLPTGPDSIVWPTTSRGPTSSWSTRSSSETGR